MLYSMLQFLQDEEFRRSLIDFLPINPEDKNYCTNKEFPHLHRYARISKYSIEDILSQRVTATNIGEFNDVFDGVMHIDCSKKTARIEENWNLIERTHNSYGLPLEKSREEFIRRNERLISRRESSGFDFIARIGMYVCCFSKDDNSTLMWSHYAASSSGLCASYDFNKLKSDALLRSCIFPVAYFDNPIVVPDYFTHIDSKPGEIERDVLATTLTKAKVWEYEQEWRLLFPIFSSPTSSQIEKRLPLLHIAPYRINLGYHFLKNFCVYADDSDARINEARENIRLFIDLLDYARDKSIELFIMVPVVRSYLFKSRHIDADFLLRFIEDHFKLYQQERPQDMRYCNAIRVELMEYIQSQDFSS